MKKLTELTEDQGMEILKYTYPDKDFSFDGLAFDSESEEGGVPISFGGRKIVGIKYFNDYPDKCILHFDNTMVVNWLYKNGFDISEQLEYNKGLTKLEEEIDDITFWLFYFARISETNKNREEQGKKPLGLDYIESKSRKAYQKYLNLL